MAKREVNSGFVHIAGRLEVERVAVLKLILCILKRQSRILGKELGKEVMGHNTLLTWDKREETKPAINETTPIDPTAGISPVFTSPCVATFRNLLSSVRGS